MKKHLLVCIIMLSSVFIFAEESAYKCTKEDIESFLAMAEEFKQFAAKYVTNAASIPDIFDLFSKLMENTKAYNPFESFLKKKKWDFTRFSAFLIRVYSTLSAMAFYDVYGEPDEGDEGLNFASDISKDEMGLIKTYKEKLVKYFPSAVSSDLGEPVDETGVEDTGAEPNPES